MMDLMHLCLAVTHLGRDSAATAVKEQQLSDKGSSARGGDAHRQGRSVMEDSFETFGEELGPLRADPAPPRPLRQTRRPEAYAPRKMREEMIPSPPPLKPEFKNPTRDVNSTRTASPAALSVSPNEKPWENVTLNRCLFVAITILVLTSGFQRLHATLRGQRPAEDDEDDAVRVRCSTSLRNRARPELPESSLWEVMFEWLPDFSDDDDEDDDDEEYENDDGGIKQKKSRSKARASSGLRNKPIPNKTLMKQREDKPKRRRAKKQKKEDTAEKKDKHEPEDGDEEEEVEATD
ncbi:junctional sarcoplasmic reticulum protein 1 [Synchiropus splendidus]|uniref:junctional sarcoplasmic reticulum protein 1 n=1 Tax=Synchiropus splendidus TaxID=270530 RepID=UPI00237D593A|nr:junctional sarcoplasmic reticulum protein 1 [Synchiropus splendidus]